MAQLRTYKDVQDTQKGKFEEGDPDRPLYEGVKSNIYDYEVDLFDNAYYEAPRESAGYLKIPGIVVGEADDYMKLPDIAAGEADEYMKIPGTPVDGGDEYMKIPEAETEGAGYLKIPDITAGDGDEYLKLDGVFEDDWAMLENEYGADEQDAINDFIEHTASKDDLKRAKDDLSPDADVGARHEVLGGEGVTAFDHHHEPALHHDAVLM